MKNRVRAVIIGGLAGIVLGIPSCVYNTFQVDKPPVHAVKSYDNHSYYVSEKNLEDMLNLAYTTMFEHVYRNDRTGKDEKKTGIGTCFPVEEKNGLQYILTANHVTEAPEKAADMFGQTYTLQSSQGFIMINDKPYKIDVVRKNKEYDIAVLRTQEDLDLDHRVKFAELPVLPGDVTYAVGFPLNIGKFLTKGVVTRIGESRILFTDAAINPGNSGCPLYVVLNGEPRVAGLCQFLIRNTQGMFGACRSSYLSDELSEALKTREIIPKPDEEKNDKSKENEPPTETNPK